MNEVNIKYGFPKNYFIDFLDELGLFIEENRFLREKISVALPSGEISWLSK
jgi:hypothetical protein